MIDLKQGDCLELIRELADNSVDLIFCDPPYNLSSEIIIRPDGKPDLKKAKDFMSKWLGLDAEFLEEWYKEAFRVLKYGGHCAMFGIDRQTFLFQYYAVLNGFQPKQSLYWYFISNFPKSSDLSKNIDKRFGLEREVVGKKTNIGHLERGDKNILEQELSYSDSTFTQATGKQTITAPNHPLAQKYNGFKYSISPLKQTCEEIMVFQKPYKHGSCLNDVLAYEKGDETITVGALNIEGNRVAVSQEDIRKNARTYLEGNRKGFVQTPRPAHDQTNGRYPAQTFIDSEMAEVLDRQSGKMGMHPAGNKKEVEARDYNASSYKFGTFKHNPNYYNDTKESAGKCSRILHKCDYEDKDFDLMIYCPKVSKSERNEGLEGFELKQVGTYAQDEWSRNNMGNTPDNKRQLVANNHPTVKPTKLLTHILKLFKTPNPQTILDPFMGSGSMGISAVECGYDYIGYELDPEYFKIAQARIENAKKQKETCLI